MSRRPNESNERLKRRFLEYRKYARQLSEKTLDREIAALERFDVWNGRKDFARFHIEWAMGFRAHLEQTKRVDGEPLSKSTMRATMATLREFVLWMSQQDRLRSRIKASDADYFSLSRRDEAEARAAPTRPAPSVRQAKRALALTPEATPREMRDKAVFASSPHRRPRRRSDLASAWSCRSEGKVGDAESARSGDEVRQEHRHVLRQRL